MRRIKWSYFDKKWWLGKVSKLDQQHMTFFVVIFPSHSYTYPSQPVHLFKCKLVEDHSKTVEYRKCQNSYYGTWNRMILDMYFYVPKCCLILPFFTMIMLCSCNHNYLSSIFDPWTTLGSSQFQRRTCLTVSSGIIDNILFFILHFTSMKIILPFRTSCIFLNHLLFTL